MATVDQKINLSRNNRNAFFNLFCFYSLASGVSRANN